LGGDYVVEYSDWLEHWQKLRVDEWCSGSFAVYSKNAEVETSDAAILDANILNVVEKDTNLRRVNEEW
jgi:hypothetical protein